MADSRGRRIDGRIQNALQGMRVQNDRIAAHAAGTACFGHRLPQKGFFQPQIRQPRQPQSFDQPANPVNPFIDTGVRASGQQTGDLPIAV